MIGAHHHAPRIFDQQVPLQADRPLQGVDQRSCCLYLIGAMPQPASISISAENHLRAVDVAEVIAQRSVAGHARRFAEQHLADVDGEVRVRVDVLGQRRRPCC